MFFILIFSCEHLLLLSDKRSEMANNYKAFSIAIFSLTFITFLCMIILLGVLVVTSKRRREHLSDVAGDPTDCGEEHHLHEVNTDNAMDKNELVAGSNL